MAKGTTPLTPWLSWLRGALRDVGATPYKIRKLTSAEGIAKFLKREEGGRYGVGNLPITISDYAARALRKETFPALERIISREAARTGRPLSEAVKKVVPVRQRRVAIERELSREVEVGGKIFKVHPHAERQAFTHYFLNTSGEFQNAAFAGDNLLAMQNYRKAVEKVTQTRGRDEEANRKLAEFSKRDIFDVSGKRFYPETDPQKILGNQSNLSRGERGRRKRLQFYKKTTRRELAPRPSPKRTRPAKRTAAGPRLRTGRGH